MWHFWRYLSGQYVAHCECETLPTTDRATKSLMELHTQAQYQLFSKSEFGRDTYRTQTVHSARAINYGHLARHCFYCERKSCDVFIYPAMVCSRTRPTPIHWYSKNFALARILTSMPAEHASAWAQFNSIFTWTSYRATLTASADTLNSRAKLTNVLFNIIQSMRKRIFQR